MTRKNTDKQTSNEPIETTEVTTPLTEIREILNGVLTRSPLSRQRTLLVLIGYGVLLITVAVTLGIYNAFGVILITNTITVFTITKHDKGAISANTLKQKISYYGLATTFGFIGLYYLMNGL